MSLLEIRNLKVWFPIRKGIFARTAGYIRAVDGVSLQIQPGETLGLVGESGCGKTTLARAILRLTPIHSGSIVFQNRNLSVLSPRQLRPLRRELQIVFQDPFASLNPRMTVMETITESLLVHGLISVDQREEAAVALLADVGMGPDALHRFPHEFSGGQRQRISIARAIAPHPRLVVCDEAVSSLDVSVRAQVLNLLMDLREKHGLSYLFISHDLSVVRQMADRLAVMYMGRVVEHGPTEIVMDTPAHPYTRALISAIPRPGEERKQRIVLGGDVPSPAHPPSGCRFHTRCPFAKTSCREVEPELDEFAPANMGRRLVACLRKGEI